MNAMEYTELQTWIETHNIIDRTSNGFWNAFNNYIQDYPEEIASFFGELNLQDIRLSLDTIEHKTIFHPDYQIADSHYSQQIVSTLDMYYKKMQIGYYQMFFHTDGECFDDSLLTQWMHWPATVKLEILTDIQKEINKQRVASGIEKDPIQKIEDLLSKQISNLKPQIPALKNFSASPTSL